MSEPRLISPLLDGFAMGGPISDHDGVCCCPAMRLNSDDKYIVKIISIPASQIQVDALLLSGAYRDRDSVLAYFKRLAEGTTREAEVLNQLSRLEGFTPYESWQIVPMQTALGYELYLVGSYKRSLSRHMERQSMTHLGAVNLGLDMCAALAVCRRSGWLYVDLKPENIYVFDEQTYRIGDLGFIALSSLKYASLPDKYRSRYTAPEITDAYSSLNTTIDIYALGLVLYQIYNGGKLPFDGTAPGESFPAPEYADYEMSEIILKACAANPADRWQDPMEMGQALIDYMQRNGVNATPIIPLPSQSEEQQEAEAQPEESAPEQDAAADAPEADPAPSSEAGAEPEADNADAGSEAEPEDEAEPEADAGDEAQTPPEEVPDAVADAQEDAPADEEAADSDAVDAEATPSAGDDLGDLSFIDDASVDETVPSGDSVLDLDGTVLSEEASAILAQADELIAHELPAPAVAPDPIDVPMPERILPHSDEAEADEASEEAAAEPAEEAAEATPQPEPEADVDMPQPPKKRRWVLILVILALLAGLAFGGYYYYENYFLQTIDDLSVHYAEEYLHVTIVSEIPDEDLIVYCTDTYGNTQKSSVIDGIASFTGLNPSTQYTLTVESTGFHKLTGKTEESYTTLSQTDIASFSAKTGSEDGSAILIFTVNGSDPDSGWVITCTAEGEEARDFRTQDHWISITGLTPGTEYTFTLSSGDDIRIAGATELVYTASAVVLAQDPAVVSCVDGALTAAWTAPEGVTVGSWTVRCYNDAGYDQTIEVSEPTAVFTGVDASSSYQIDITAAGQTQSVNIEMSSEPITVISTLAEPGKTALNFQWTYSGGEPVGGWIVSYTIDGGAAQEILTAESAVSISPVIPGSRYTFTIRASDDRTVFSEAVLCDIPAADTFDSYKIAMDDMTFNMLVRPEKENWTYSDVKNTPYTTTFSAGQKASFLVVLSHWQSKSSDEIRILYVVRDADGVPVSADTQTTVWNDMWDNGYCELDVPTIPAAPGDYTLEIYFNLDLASVTNFTVQ